MTYSINYTFCPRLRFLTTKHRNVYHPESLLMHESDVPIAILDDNTPINFRSAVRLLKPSLIRISAINFRSLRRNSSVFLQIFLSMIYVDYEVATNWPGRLPYIARQLISSVKIHLNQCMGIYLPCLRF